MNDTHRGTRYRLDFMSNPAYPELLDEIHKLKMKEMGSLLSAGRGEAEHQFNHQAGIVDGVERVELLMQRLERDAKEAMSGDKSEG